jgi:hypothetical protein
MSNTRAYSVPLLNTEEAYSTTPLINIYLLIAKINHIIQDDMRRHLGNDDESVYFKKQPDIPFCVNHNLLSSSIVPINMFNFTELLSALDNLELSLSKVSYSTDLLLYLEALEFRIADFLLYTQTGEELCIAECRQPFPTPADQKHDPWYVLTGSAEYMLIVRIISIRHDMLGALPSFRNHSECIREPFNEELAAMPIMFNALMEQIQRIHSDNTQNKFTDSYRRNSLITSVGYFWLKDAIGDFKEPDVASAYSRFLGLAAWNNVCERASYDLGEHFYKMNDPLGFWIAFYLVMDIILRMTLRMPWANKDEEADDTKVRLYDYIVPDVMLREMNDDELNNMLMRSNNAPIIVQSFNDAGLIFKEKLYIFGNKPVDFLRALYNWILIIDEGFGGVLAGIASIYELKRVIFKPNAVINTKHIKDRSAIDTHISQLQIKTIEQRTEEQRQKRISFVLSSQRSTELELEGFDADEDGKGLRPSISSAWSDED